jgi:hypothetical protein
MVLATVQSPPIGASSSGMPMGHDDAEEKTLDILIFS